MSRELTNPTDLAAVQAALGISVPARDIRTPGYYEIAVPTGFRGLELTLVGSGGGGGSGARRAVGGVRTGGGGGGGGNTHKAVLRVADLGGAGAVIPVYIGRGGRGGASITANDTNGAAGSQGAHVGIGTVTRPVAWPPLATMAGIASNTSIMVAVGSAGAIYTSTDGDAWTSRTSGTANALNSVAWSASLGLFVAVGAAGTILTSPDGIAWTSRTSGTANALNHVLCDGAYLTAVGAAGTIVTSPDGITWTVNVYASAATLNQVATDGAGKYIAVDTAGNIVTATSPTGTWTATLVMPMAAQAINGIAYGAGLWVIAAANNGKCYTSPDGVAWADRGGRFQRFQSPLNFVSGTIQSDVPGGVTGVFVHERDYSFDGLAWYRVAHGGPGYMRFATLFKGELYFSSSTWFVTRLSRIVTAFTPVHVMGALGGGGGATAAAAGGGQDGSGLYAGSAGAASVITGSAGIPTNATGSGGGGAGGGATAANASIGPSLGAEGSIAGSYTLQGFQGVSGGVGPCDGGSGGVDPTLMGSSGGGGGAWTSATVGQTGGAGGTPGGGGGGGAAADNGYASGAGGNGGDAQARLLWF